MFLTACREDGSFDNNSQYSFSVERDDNFPEKSINETTNLKFDLKTKYDFKTIPITFKYTTDLDGVLYLNGTELEINKVYTFDNAENTFEYKGIGAGEHNIEIIVKNDKGYSVTEKFNLKYGVSDFSVESSNNTGDFYQGKTINFFLKITPNKPQNTYGYEIRIDEFDDTHPNSKIFLEHKELQKGVFYPIHVSQIQNVKLNAIFWTAGQRKIKYTIKNSTVTRTGFDISQNVLARSVNVVSLSPSKVLLPKNGKLNFAGIVTKGPIQDNNEIYYKTWVSSANPNAIDNTNNNWILYSIGSSNTFNLNSLNANEFGEHVYNIQFKDEFGNLSDIQSFNIKVDEALKFTQMPNVFVYIERHREILNGGIFNGQVLMNFKHKGGKPVFEAKAGLNNKITKYKVDYTFVHDGNTFHKSYEQNYSVPQETINVNHKFDDDHEIWSRWGHGVGWDTAHYASGTYTLYVYDSQGNVLQHSGNLEFFYNY